MTANSGVSVKIDDSGLKRKLKKLKDSVDSRELMEAIGFRLIRWIGQNFRDEGTESPWKELSPNTIAARREGPKHGRGNRILQDRGALMQSFDQEHAIFKVSVHRVYVGSNLKYAPAHQYGTEPRRIIPRRGGLLKFITAGGWRSSKGVNHPGLPARPILPSDKTAKDLAVALIEAKLKQVTGSGGG